MATTFDKLVHDYLVEHGIQAETIHLDGAVESSVQLGVADLIRRRGLHPVPPCATPACACLPNRSCTPEACLIRSPRLNEQDSRLAVLTRRLQGVLTAHQYVLMDYDIPISKVAAAVAVTPGFESPTISPLHDKQWNAVRVMVPKAKVNQLMDDLYESAHAASSLPLCKPPACRLLVDMTNQKVNARYSPEARDIYFTVPNLISALRIISIPFISVLISKHEMIAALALIAISSASDGLDGIIARRFNQVSKIGQILDPIADRLLIFCSILALSVAGIIPWWMLIIVGLRDLWMAIQVLWLAQYGYGPLPVHFVGKAGTALLMISIVSLIFADLGTNTFFHLLYIAALAAGIWGIAMYWLAGYIYTKQGVGCYARNWGRSMALEATAPVSFPVPKENEPVRRRAVFSHSVRCAESHHALSPDDAAAIRTRRRRKTNDDSLQLIDDLVNRPMDPMFSDSRLVHEHRSTFSIWF